MRINASRLAMALVAVILGFMLAMQYKIQQRVVAADHLASQRSQELVNALKKAEEERDKLAADVTDLRGRLAEAMEERSHYGSLFKEMELAQVNAGLVAVKGPGVKVVLDDSKRVRRAGEDPNQFIIHDDDILRTVNELRAAGAEAISINGQRLVARTEIRCAGPVVTINGVRTSVPVEILAIGKAADIENALRMRGGIVDDLEFWQIQVSIERKDELIVPAYSGSLQFLVGQPVTQKEAP